MNPQTEAVRSHGAAWNAEPGTANPLCQLVVLRNVLTSVLALLIVLTPITYWPAQRWLSFPSYDLGLGIAFTLFILSHLFPKPRVPKMTWSDAALALFFAWVVLNSKTIGSSEAAAALVDLMILFFVVSHTEFTGSQSKLLVCAMLVAGALVAGIGAFQYIVYSRSVVPSTLRNANAFSGYLSLVLPMSLCLWCSDKRLVRILGMVLTTTMALGVALAVTRAGYIVCLAAMILFAMVKDRRLLMVPIAYLLLLGWLVEPARARFFNIREVSAVLADDSSATHNNVVSRWRLWEFGWQQFKTSPWTGIGIGNYRKHLEQYRQSGAPGSELMQETVEPHNSFVKVLSEQGLPGLLLFLSVLGAGAWKASNNVFAARGSLGGCRWSVRHAKEVCERVRAADPWGVAILCGLGAFLLHNLTNTLFIIVPCALGFWIVLGLVAGVSGKAFCGKPG